MTLESLVSAFCLRTGYTANKAWKLTLSDLILSCPKENNNTDTVDWNFAATQQMERWERLAKLTVEQRVELEQWKSELM